MLKDFATLLAYVLGLLLSVAGIGGLVHLVARTVPAKPKKREGSRKWDGIVLDA